MIQQTTKRKMLMPTQIYDLARLRISELKRVEEEKATALRKSPQGKIHIVKSRRRVQFYLRMESCDKSGTYIKKKDEPLIKRYLQKSYDEKVQKLVQKEIKSIENFLKHSENFNYKIQQIYSDNFQEVQKYITPVDCSDEDYINYWKNIPYEKNPMPIQTTEYKTDSGEYVRSKSELNIANALWKFGIPYKYECPLKLKDGGVVYPDFTILQVKNRQQLYWEHRGMMDDREYAKNAVKKLKIYSQNGIIVGENLIITEETVTSPLGTNEISAVIKMITGRNNIIGL